MIASVTIAVHAQIAKPTSPIAYAIRVRLITAKVKRGLQVAGITKPVPPTPYYYGKRADLFLRQAMQWLAQGNEANYNKYLLKAIEYRELSGQFPIEKGLYDPTTNPLETGKVLEV